MGVMTAGKEIRDSFLDFFKDKTHTVVQSSSLVPQQDPTLLFTNAGMVQFKNIFLGVERPAFKRAASAQKCLRISGKHNDLEAVGRDTYHHTFFEMLGNWSFGDYYKEEAIAWAWELLTKEWGLPADKLYATVFRNDDEAEGLWRRISGLPRAACSVSTRRTTSGRWATPVPAVRAARFTWTGVPRPATTRTIPATSVPSTATAPATSSSGTSSSSSTTATLRESSTNCPSKHVDTGMGLERITAVLQGVFSNYDVDLFRNIITATEKLAGKAYGDNAEADVSFRVIADHARAVSSLIADGVFPSNDGRSYVLRRLLRRAARHGRLLGFEEPFLSRLVEPVAGVLGEAYPELRAAAERIKSTIHVEETRFADTLDKGLVLLEDSLAELRKTGGQSLPGDVAFRLYDTYGFPVDLTEDILRGEGLTVDHEGFERLMEEQRTRARAAAEFVADASPIRFEISMSSATGEGTEPLRSLFLGYDCMKHKSQVTALYRGDVPVKEASEGDVVDVIVAETPFYAESGGQVGDQGTILTDRKDAVHVQHAWHPVPGLTVHRGEVTRGRIAVGDIVDLAVNELHRGRAMLNHSATHILHAVLREELGTGVRQAGSLVAPDRLRFDFTHGGQVDPEILERIEREVNQRIRENAGVSTEEMDYDDAIRAGAMAFFGDKYGDRVRVVRIGDFSTELCGGTHIHQSGDIGLFRLSAEGGVSAGVRRIEAVTGATAFDVMHAYDAVLSEVNELLRSTNEDAADKVRRLLERQKELERQVAELKSQLGQDRVPELLGKAQKNAAGASFIVERVEGLDARQLRETVDQLRQQLPGGFVFLACPGEKNVMLAAGAGSDLDGRYHAGDIIKQVAPTVGGGGGGRADFAQAGGKQPQKTDDALRLAREIVSRIS